MKKLLNLALLISFIVTILVPLYQFGTEDGVRRFYQRTLEKLRLLMG